MTSPSQVRSPRSKHYDGVVYGRLVEPLLGGVHAFVADHLPPGDRVLDACCGTGGLARRLAARGLEVRGVDLSPRNIDHAQTRSAGLAENLRFEVGDVSQIEPPAAGPYDVATIVLALHEMPAAARAAVLEALLGAAERVMAVDFAIPMPWNLAGVRNRAMELAAGPEHFSAFRDFTRRGGLPRLVEETGAVIESTRRIDSGALEVVVLQGR